MKLRFFAALCLVLTAQVQASFLRSWWQSFCTPVDETLAQHGIIHPSMADPQRHVLLLCTMADTIYPHEEKGYFKRILNREDYNVLFLTSGISTLGKYRELIDPAGLIPSPKPHLRHIYFDYRNLNCHVHWFAVGMWVDPSKIMVYERRRLYYKPPEPYDFLSNYPELKESDFLSKCCNYAPEYLTKASACSEDCDLHQIYKRSGVPLVEYMRQNVDTLIVKSHFHYNIFQLTIL